MSKVSLLQDDEEALAYSFYCAGCKCSHSFVIRRNGFTRDMPNRPPGLSLWTWNGDFEKPTVFPSINCNPNYPPRRCHSFVENGKIRYLNDSYHHLKNQTVDLEDDD